MKTQISVVILIIILLISCTPLDASTTETIITVETTLTSTPIIKTPIRTQTSIVAPTSVPLPSLTATKEPKPFLIAYAYSSDGGDDFVRCIQEDTGHPRFILYQDGVLIKFDYPYYLQSQLSSTQIDDLLKEIKKTGLFQQNESRYREGSSVLVVDGKNFFEPFNLPETDPLRKAIEIVLSFQQENATRFVPENLALSIFSVDKLSNVIKNWLTEPNPVFEDWQNSPLFKSGEGQFIITGKDVPIVMEQFPGFPGFRVYQNSESKRYYVASICTIYPYR